MLPQTYTESDIQYEIPYTRKIDFETKLEQEEQTEENLIKELKENAERYIEENKYPKVSYTTVSNINDKMEIGDTIQVLHPLVSIKTEVLEYEYDIISKKMKSLTFGNFSRDVKTKFDNIKNSINQISQAMSKQETVIKNQTSLINMLNKTGFVYIDENEILILDEIPKENAKNVWRFGLGGLAFSSNGYEGPFETAITMDGQINANFITAGTISVSRIEGLFDELEGLRTAIQLDMNGITASLDTLQKEIDKTNEQVTENETQQSKYLRYYSDPNNNNKGTLELGESESPFKTKITNEEMAFTQDGYKVAYINGNKLYITTAEVLNALIIGNFGFTPLSNGSLSFGKIK